MKRSVQKTVWKAAAALCAAAFFLGAVCMPSAAQIAPPPQVSAKSAALLDGMTGECLYAKNGNQRALIASTTKIMTGLLVCEADELEKNVTVPDAAVGLEGSSMYLKNGETLTRRDLLYGMMLHSGNDAALTLAISVSGGEAAFVRQMNLRARALGLTQTHFANPHGLDSGENYSTALDLAHLAQAALQNAQFRLAVSTKSITCAGRTLTNHNKLLWRYDGCIGVKTGYTRHAGRILVSAAERDGRMLIAVTISDPDDWRDHAALLDYGFDNFSYVTALSPLYPIDQVTVLNSAGSEAVAVAPAKDVRLLLPANYNPDALRTEILLDAKEVEAPVSEGQKLGLARVYYGNELIDETDLLAIADVTRSEFSSVASTSTAYIQQNWWKWIVFLILGVIAAFLILLVLLQIRRRRLRRLRLEKRRRDLEKQYRRRYRDDREE